MWLPVIAVALFAIAFTIPHIPQLYGSRSRGDFELELEVLREGELIPHREAGAISPDDRVAIRYIPTGYLYLWVIEIRPDRRVRRLVPASSDVTMVYGWRAETRGGRVFAPQDVGRGEGPLVVYTLLSPIPLKASDLIHAVEEAEATSPEEIAREIYFPGRSKVFVLERRPEAATATATISGG